MIDGSAGNSLQSLREFSSENSEFELVDIVDSRLSVHSKQPSSVGILRSPTSPAFVQISAKSNHPTPMQKETVEHHKVHDNEQKMPNSMDLFMENERLRIELAEVNAQLATLNKEVEVYRQKLSESEKEKADAFDKAAEKWQTADESSTEPRKWKNGTKTSSMCVCLGSTLQESKIEKPKEAMDQFDEGTTNGRPMRMPLVSSSKTAFGARSSSSPPLSKLSPPRNVADAQLLDLLGSVQPMRDANRPAAPPPKKNSWCKVCGQWLCNSYFLRAHIKSQHATHGEHSGENGGKRGVQKQNGTDLEGVSVGIGNSLKKRSTTEEFVVGTALFEPDPSCHLIDVNDAETHSIPRKIVRPKPIRPVPNGKFQIKWEEEEETEEEELWDSENLWSLIGQVGNKTQNGNVGSGKNLSNELPKSDEHIANGTQNQRTDSYSPIVHCPSSTNSPSVSSPSVPNFRSLSSDPNCPQRQFSSSSSSPSDSTLTSSTASSTLSSTNGTSEVEQLFLGQRRHKGTAQEENGETQNEAIMQTSRLDDSILNRLLHIEPPNASKQKQPLDTTCHTFVTNSPSESPNNFRRIETPNGSGGSDGRNIGKELDKLRDDFQTLQFLHEGKDRQTNERLETLECRVTQLNVKLGRVDTQTEAVHGEQKKQMANLLAKNGRLCEAFGEHQKGLKAVQNRIDLLEQCHLREFVASLPPVHEDGSLVLSQFENGKYCAEMKMLFRSGSRFCSGFAIKSSAHFRNYPSNLFNQLIGHALTTRQVQKMLRWAVLNFPANGKCPWPQVLLSISNCTVDGEKGTDGNKNSSNELCIYRNWIRRRAVISDRVVYSLINQHSSHKFVVNIYYSSEAELFKQMHCFTIRRHRPSH